MASSTEGSDAKLSALDSLAADFNITPLSRPEYQLNQNQVNAAALAAAPGGSLSINITATAEADRHFENRSKVAKLRAKTATSISRRLKSEDSTNRPTGFGVTSSSSTDASSAVVIAATNRPFGALGQRFRDHPCESDSDDECLDRSLNSSLRSGATDSCADRSIGSSGVLDGFDFSPGINAHQSPLWLTTASPLSRHPVDSWPSHDAVTSHDLSSSSRPMTLADQQRMKQQMLRQSIQNALFQQKPGFNNGCFSSVPSYFQNNGFCTDSSIFGLAQHPEETARSSDDDSSSRQLSTDGEYAYADMSASTSSANISSGQDFLSVPSMTIPMSPIVTPTPLAAVTNPFNNYVYGAAWVDSMNFAQPTNHLALEQLSGDRAIVISSSRSSTRRKRFKSEHPKGISTAGKSWRIQVQVESSDPSSKKAKYRLSRNLTDYKSALWLYEVALLFSDRPDNLNEQMASGNYTVMLEKEIVTDPESYYTELGRRVFEFSQTELRGINEGELAIGIYDKLIAHNGVSLSQLGQSCRQTV